MANTFLGVAVTFGVAGIGITGTGIGTLKLQSVSHKKMAEKDVIKDADGTDVQATLFNPSQEATFEYIPSSATKGASDATIKAATVIPEPGAIVTVTETTQYTSIAGTTWFVWDDPQIVGSNTGAYRVTLHLKKWTGTGAIAAVTT